MNWTTEQLQYDSTVIKPPKDKNKDLNTKYLYIDSRDRNYSTSPNSNEYVFYINETLRNVVEVELLSINLPIDAIYPVNNTNNMIYYSTDLAPVSEIINNNNYIRDNTSILKSQQIPKGYYKRSISSTNVITDNFKDQLEIELNKDNDYNFSVTSTSVINKYIIQPTTDVASNEGLFFHNTNNLINFDSYGEKHNKLLDNTIGPILGMNRNYTPFINGVVHTEQNNEIITGHDTSFLTDLEHLGSGDQITIVNTDISGNPIFETLKINTINSNTEITLDNTTLPQLTRSNCQLSPVKFIGNTCMNLEGEDVIFLHIEEFEKMEGDSQGAIDSFCKINLGRGTQDRSGGKLKLFTNTNDVDINKLDRLRISFKDYNNNLVDFNNREHNFVLAISYYVQSNNYNY